MNKSISLVLGSGGARGYAHIGVIEALETAGFTIRAIAGSSMGALIGGLYANQTLNKYKEWVLTLDFLDLLRLVDFTFSEAGIIKGDRVFDQMAYLLGDVTIEELPILYTAVATDLVKRREVWFQRGSLKQAIRASIAIPMVFTPVRQGKRILVDGGILNPLPLAPTVSHHTDLVVAVNLNASQGQSYSIALPQEEKDKQDQFQNNLRRFLGNLSWNFRRKERPSGISMFEIMHRTFETMQQSLSNYKIVGYPPDVIIQIPADACNFYDFHKAYTMIELGRAATNKVLENMKISDS
jgi:NTE family protein